jgi:hypothetical protein
MKKDTALLAVSFCRLAFGASLVYSRRVEVSLAPVSVGHDHPADRDLAGLLRVKRGLVVDDDSPSSLLHGHQVTFDDRDSAADRVVPSISGAIAVGYPLIVDPASARRVDVRGLGQRWGKPEYRS